ncbi:hypothetical protein ACLOJK_037400, partial [Asimina triloba]
RPIISVPEPLTPVSAPAPPMECPQLCGFSTNGTNGDYQSTTTTNPHALQKGLRCGILPLTSNQQDGKRSASLTLDSPISRCDSPAHLRLDPTVTHARIAAKQSMHPRIHA